MLRSSNWRCEGERGTNYTCRHWRFPGENPRGAQAVHPGAIHVREVCVERVYWVLGSCTSGSHRWSPCHNQQSILPHSRRTPHSLIIVRISCLRVHSASLESETNG